MGNAIFAGKTLKLLSKNLRIYLPVFFLIAILAFVSFRGFYSSGPKETEIYSMNTIIDIKVWGEERNQAISDINKEIYYLNSLFDDYTKGTDVSNINENAGIKAVNVSQETISILNEALGMYYETQESFNICIGPISRLWGFKDGNYRVPTETEIERTLKLVDIADLRISGNSVYLSRRGEMIDLGGIAKGYALDKILTILKSYKITDAIVNMGGNVLTYSTNPSKVWKIGIRDPRSDGIIGTLSIKGIKFIATSGDYERFFEANGVRYCHIFDPETGKPASKIVSVTVVADKGYISDVLSTSFFVLGKNPSLVLADKFDVNVVGFDNALTPFYSEGSKGILSIENR